MTRYRDRLEEGHYELGTITTVTLDEPKPQAPQPTETNDSDWPLEERSLQELRDQAEALGLKTYGTKADIAKRISDLEQGA